MIARRNQKPDRTPPKVARTLIGSEGSPSTMPQTAGSTDAAAKELEFDTMTNPVTFADTPGSPFDTSDIFKQIELESEQHIPWWDRQLQAHPPLRTCWEFAFHPNTPKRLMWDVLVLLLVIYSSFWDPYEAAFAVVNLDFDPDAWTYSRVKLYIIDAIFWADIIVSFHTGYDKGFEVIMKKNRIIKNYATGWFTIDLIATVPWDYLIGIIMETIMTADNLAGDTGTGTTLANKIKDSPIVRLLRLARVLRLARASRLINRLFQSKTVHSGYVEAVKFFTYVSVVAHLLACFFFMWPMLTQCAKDPDMADESFLTPSSSTVGWHWELASGGSTCMQNSWRQSYGLETVCPQETDDNGGASC